MDQTYTELDRKILLVQIKRREKFRKEFLKLRTDPSKHMAEFGFVFDAAVARFQSMKATQLDHFRPNFRTIRFAVLSMLPMFVYGFAICKHRGDREKQIRCGKIRYRDRDFKLQ